MNATNETLPILPKSRKEHTESEWDHVRPYFTELYLTKKKPLVEVSRILEEEWYFAATEKQYKDRVRKWGLRKNFKAQEKELALAAGVTSKTDQLVTHDKIQIPEKRLRRWARDEKLQYVERLGEPSPSPRTPNYDIVVELPRNMIEQGTAPRVVHFALAALDRLCKARYPLLNFSVLGISDAAVRYGVSYDKRGASVVMVHNLPEKMGVKWDKPVKYTGISYETSWANFQRYSDPPENRRHLDMLRFLCHKLFPICQEKFLPAFRGPASGQGIGGKAPLQYTPPALIRLPTFRMTARTAEYFYLHLMAHSAIGAAAKMAFEGASPLEMATDLVGGNQPRVVGEGGKEESIFDDTVKHTAMCHVEIDSSNKRIYGTIKIPQVIRNEEAVKFEPIEWAPTTAAATQNRAFEVPKEMPSVELLPNQYLLGSVDNAASMDSEFQAAAQRAAKALQR